MKKLLIMILLISLIVVKADEFEVFKEKKEDQKIYNNLKQNKFKIAPTFYFQGSEKNIGASFEYNYLFNKKIGTLFELAYRDFGSTKENFDINAGISYRFTRRTQSTVFFGEAGISFNKYLETQDDLGFHHAFGGIIAEYTFDNGFGVDIGARAYMPFDYSVDADMIIRYRVNFIYQF
ncbi:MAG: hypothetical protein JXR48_08025 [Candidatus Delongbacteria bacterium]|nr:hypothetical protein [Candidatus Delongbacteria bacterium]MBN2834900.1 hypothetical protein [Candidatus Delongbacteria bacterium]